MQKEETLQMQEELKETIGKVKRNKSHEPAGALGEAERSEDGFNSQGSLEVLADDEDDQQRLKELIDAEGYEKFVNVPAKDNSASISLSNPAQSGVDNKKLIEAQK